MNKTLLTLAITMSGFAAVAQIQKADELDNEWDYSDAAVLYEKAVASHPDANTYYKLGECYRKMGKYDKALSAYDKVNGMGDYSNPDFYLQYGQMLKTAREYDKAKAAFQKYEKMQPYDTRGKMYENSCDIAVEDNKNDLPLDIQDLATINTPQSEFSPQIFRDGLVITTNWSSSKHNKIDESTGSPYLAIYSAGKNNDSSFQSTTLLNGSINLEYHDGPACFSKNYDTMYFTRVTKDMKVPSNKKYMIERSKIYYATIVNGDWGGVTAFPFNSDSFSVGHPALSKDGGRLYFASDMPGGVGGVDIGIAIVTMAVGAGQLMPDRMLMLSGGISPSIDSLGNLYFSSDGYVGFGGLDICVAMNKNGSFEKAQVLKCPLNSPADDFGMVFIANGKRGYFSSNRDGGKGSDDIYYFDMGKDKNLTTDVYVIGYKKPVLIVEAPIKKASIIDERAPAPQDTTFDSLDIHVLFDFNKYDLRYDAAYKLGRIVAYLNTHTNKMVQVNGYTDI